MEVNQHMGVGNIRTTAKKVVGEENSYGIKVLNKAGKDTTDIQDLVDM